MSVLVIKKATNGHPDSSGYSLVALFIATWASP